MVFCNLESGFTWIQDAPVTILILIDGFLQLKINKYVDDRKNVTILILIDGFLQCKKRYFYNHNSVVTILILIDGFLQYKTDYLSIDCLISHNPYFNRWFSAINDNYIKVEYFKGVTILILIDGFLQFSKSLIKDSSNWSQSLF